MPWPYMSSQCPTCWYFLPFEPEAEDDAGYTLPGACQHPLIGMELFVSKDRPEFMTAQCDLRWPAPSAPADTGVDR
ncbi:MAG TPA: hypothetical protein VMB51_04480 [Solirubrobacteraceae bacterium]|nr:hypothetical protein [Solirubrobacteraceae bacterium]